MTDRIEEWVFACITACLAWCYRMLCKKMKQQREENEALKDGMRSLLRDRIIENYNKYTDRGSIPIYAMTSVDALYGAYHSLGGNGVVTELVDRIRSLEIEGGHTYENH